MKQGGASSPNKAVPPSAYADPLQRVDRHRSRKGEDLPVRPVRPPAVRVRGRRPARGSFKLFQDFLKNPSNVNGIAAKMEAAAAKAYKG